MISFIVIRQHEKANLMKIRDAKLIGSCKQIRLNLIDRVCWQPVTECGNIEIIPDFRKFDLPYSVTSGEYGFCLFNNDYFKHQGLDLF